MRIIAFALATLALIAGPSAAYAEEDSSLDPIITVSCDRNFDPPVIHIVILGIQGYTVPYGSYDSLRALDPSLPENPCL